MLLGERFLAAVSPDVARDLQPWFMLCATDPIPTNLLDPVCQLIIDVLEIQVTFRFP